MNRFVGAVACSVPRSVVMCAVGVASVVGAQEGAQPSPFAGDGQRVARVGQIDASAAPELDGVLLDPCWITAPEIGPLVQVEPVEGVIPEHRTVVRLLQDRDAIYLAIQCFDVRPGEIRASQRQRDANLDPDDRVEWLFDTFRSQSQGYWFQIGAGGSRGDALVSQGGNSFNKSWDTIWDGDARVTDTGWQAEVRIPFRSLALRDGDASWGFNLRRLRRASNEEYRWNLPVQGRRFFQVAEAGEMRGLGPTRAGAGVELVPYALMQAGRVRSVDRDFEFDPDVGGEINYRLTPQLSVAATFFTDFAETENDSRQINLNRFALFFPEKRDFFLQDAGRFEFGPDGSRGSLLPFFSRRIGLASGQPVPILAGVKLAGEVGPWSLGLLSAQTDAVAGLETDRNLSVARVSRRLGAETAVGGIVTHGRPTQPGNNTVVGVDGYHREPDWWGGMDLRVWGCGLVSQTSGEGGDGNAWGARFASNGREWDFGGRVEWVTADFNPEMGFLRRSGIKRHGVNLGYRPRLGGQLLRRFNLRVSGDWLLDESNRTNELEFEIDELGLETNEGGEIAVFASRALERVNQDFSLFNDTATVVAGDYWQTRIGLRAETSDGRPFSVGASISEGDFFDGTSLRASVGADWRTGPLLILGAEVSRNEVSLPQGSFDTLVVEGQVDFHFSPWVSWLNLVQFDNESDVLGAQSRLRWIMSPGSDLFVVASGGWLRQSGQTIPEEQALTLKVSHSIRF